MALKNTNAQKLLDNAIGNTTKLGNNGSLVFPKVSAGDLKLDMGKKKNFYGIDLGGKAALFLGLEGGLKIGFYGK